MEETRYAWPWCSHCGKPTSFHLTATTANTAMTFNGQIQHIFYQPIVKYEWQCRWSDVDIR